MLMDLLGIWRRELLIVVNCDNDDWSCMQKKSKKGQAYKKQMVFMGLALGVLACLLFGQDVRQGQVAMKEGILRGNTASEVYEEDYVLEYSDGRKSEVSVTVYPREQSQEQVTALLEQATEEFEQGFLGDNPSADKVSSNLVFPTTLCDGMVQAQYETDNPLLIWEDGAVDLTVLKDEGQLVQIQATFSCQQSQLVYVCYVQVVPAPVTLEEQQQQAIAAWVAQEEAKSRQEERFMLPQTMNGEAVTWHKKRNTDPLLFLVLGIVAMVCIWKKKEQEERMQRQQRQKQLLREYSQMVSQLTLLMGAGMPLFTAWERMVKRYLQEQTKAQGHQGTKGKDLMYKERLYLQEMALTYREMKEGANLGRAYEAFGNRIGLAPYRKLTALLVQNMNKGTKDLVQCLDLEAELVLEEQKNNVRRLGEEAGSKLLFPMLILFVMILVIIMVPAVQSF